MTRGLRASGFGRLRSTPERRAAASLAGARRAEAGIRGCVVALRQHRAGVELASQWLLLALITALLLMTRAVAAQDQLAAARDLYASARYDEALTMLNGLKADESLPTERVRSVEQYRSLCLLALGRPGEAQSAIEAVVAADPFYRPNESEASPRVRTAFSDVRRRMLPGLTTAEYIAAKAAYDRKDYKNAAEHFRRVLTFLNDPDVQGQQQDLLTLATGFLELSVAASAPPPAPPPPEPKPAPAGPDPLRVYTADDADVVAPVVVRQEMPRIPADLVSRVQPRGLIEIVVNEAGRVEQAGLRQSIHPVYDAMVLSAVKEWRYKPATLQGRPVKFRKAIQLFLDKTSKPAGNQP